MARIHTYDLTVSWTGNTGSGTSGYRDFSRDHMISAVGPQPIRASSDPALAGDPARWNPEQLMTAALAQCHMLWYLHLCAVAGVVVTDYVDQAHGEMAEHRNGGQFTDVVLRPRVRVAAQNMVEKAIMLHEDAHRCCFIANSVNFPVRCDPAVTTE